MRLRRVWLAIGWLLMLAVLVLSLIPPPEPQIELPHGDKYMHFLAYFCLMAWFAQLYPRGMLRMGYAVGIIAWGILIEGLQGLTGYRQMDGLDVLVNSLGVISACLLIRGRLAQVLLWLEHRLHLIDKA